MDALPLVAPDLDGVAAFAHADGDDNGCGVGLGEAYGAVLEDHGAVVVGRVFARDGARRVLDGEVEVLDAVRGLRVDAVAVVGLRLEGVRLRRISLPCLPVIVLPMGFILVTAAQPLAIASTSFATSLLLAL